MTLLGVVQVLAVLSCGLSAGILFGDRMGNTYARPALSPAEFTRFQKIQNRYFARMMPIVLLTAVAGGLAWTILLRGQWNGLQFGLVAVATAAIILGAMLTGTINVPINKQLDNWSEANPPANPREIWGRWEKFHTVRTALFLGAFAMQALATAA